MNLTALSDPLSLTAAGLMVLNGVFGIVCNLLIVYIFVRAPSERNSFNLICICRGIGNCLILGWAFLATFVPMTLLGDSLFSPIYQTIVITSVNSTYTGLQYCGILIAANRFVAMYFTRFYSRVFNKKFTALQLIILFTYRAIRLGLELNWNIPKECFTIFSSQTISWLPDFDDICRSAPSSIIDGSAVILGALMIMNLATFVKIYIFYKSTDLEEKEVKRKVRKNKILFIQTILQDVTYLIDMLFTYKLFDLIPERYWSFISGSFVWESVHSFDGLIMIMFNERLTFLRRTFFPSSSHPTIVPPAKQTVSTATPSRNLIAPVN